MPAVDKKAMMLLTPVTGIRFASPCISAMLRAPVCVSMAAASTNSSPLNVAWLKKCSIAPVNPSGEQVATPSTM